MRNNIRNLFIRTQYQPVRKTDAQPSGRKTDTQQSGRISVQFHYYAHITLVNTINPDIQFVINKFKQIQTLINASNN